MTGLHNGFAIIDVKDKIHGEPKIIMSGLEYDQAEREFLRIKKETLGNSVLQDGGSN